MRAINRVASKTRTAASKAIREDVRLPASYVNENLKVSQKASINNPEAVITARKRPTRLARYGAKQLARAAKMHLATRPAVLVPDASRRVYRLVSKRQRAPKEA